MDAEEFKRRTRLFGLRIYKLVKSLPHIPMIQTLGGQLLRAGTSVGANYRAACLARSVADFIAKLKIVEEECDEAIYWLEFLTEAGEIKRESCAELIQEGHEILAMAVASIKTARTKLR